MAIKGDDKGTDRSVRITSDGELIVRAIIEEEIEHASSDGRAFTWTSLNTDVAAGSTRLIIRNTSDKFLILDRAIFNRTIIAAKPLWSERDPVAAFSRTGSRNNNA